MTSQVLFEDGDDGDDISSTHYHVEMIGGPDDHFGLCPECGKPPMIADVGAEHWGYCKDHKVAWGIGWNLFSSWRDQTKEQTEANRRFLADFKVIEPSFAPSDREVDLEVKGLIDSLEQDENPFSQDAPDWATSPMAGDDPNRSTSPVVNVTVLRETITKILQEAEELLSRRGHDVKADDVDRIFALGGKIQGISYLLASVVTANETLRIVTHRLGQRASAMAEVFGTPPVSDEDFTIYTDVSGYWNMFGRYPAIGLGDDGDGDIPF